MYMYTRQTSVCKKVWIDLSFEKTYIEKNTTQHFKPLIYPNFYLALPKLCFCQIKVFLVLYFKEEKNQNYPEIKKKKKKITKTFTTKYKGDKLTAIAG